MNASQRSVSEIPKDTEYATKKTQAPTKGRHGADRRRKGTREKIMIHVE